MTTVAIITDIHNGPDKGTKMGSAAPGLMKKFLAFVNERQPDLVLDLGDRVNQVSPTADAASLRDVAVFFEQMIPPRIHLMGNHDVDYLTLADNEKIMGRSFQSCVKKSGDFTFVRWNARANLDSIAGFDLPEEDISWLENAIKDISYPAIICTHVPLNNGSMTGNFYFEKKYRHQAHYPFEKAVRARKILERSGKVILCLNGHAHWNAYQCIDGIHYVTLPSLTETFLTHPEPHGAWSWLELSADKIDIEIFGNIPMRYILPVRKQGHHWINIDNDYSPTRTHSG